MAAMYSHIPNKGEQMVRYYDFYSNLTMGKCKKADIDDHIPWILKQELTELDFRLRYLQRISNINI
jgi:hypothetical protein